MIIPCDACGKDHSASAVSCPACGHATVVRVGEALLGTSGLLGGFSFTGYVILVTYVTVNPNDLFMKWGAHFLLGATVSILLAIFDLQRFLVSVRRCSDAKSFRREQRWLRVGGVLLYLGTLLLCGALIAMACSYSALAALLALIGSALVIIRIAR
ncbi:hypothetical protein ACFL59_15005 [Planctomycetota bacterium]